MNVHDIVSITSGNDSINTNMSKYSNDHVEHSPNFGYGSKSSVIFASIDEWDQKCRVGTQSSIFRL